MIIHGGDLFDESTPPRWVAHLAGSAGVLVAATDSYGYLRCYFDLERPHLPVGKVGHFCSTRDSSLENEDVEKNVTYFCSFSQHVRLVTLNNILNKTENRNFMKFRPISTRFGKNVSKNCLKFKPRI